MKPLVGILIITVVLVAATALWSGRPGPVFSLADVSAQRSCFYNTTQGNYSYWDVDANLTNTGPSASAAVTIAIDATAVVSQYDFVASGATVEIHHVVKDASIPTDTTCLAHDVTVGIGGYVF